MMSLVIRTNLLVKEQKMKGLIWIVVLVVIVGLAFVFVGGDKEDTEEVATLQTFEITLNNLSDSQPLSPGVLVVHNDRFNLDYEGSLSPDELESLAEYGDNVAFLAYVEGARGVEQVINIDAPILPGGTRTFEVTVPSEDGHLLVSVLGMLVATNDGLAVVASEPLFDEVKTARGFTALALNYDNGTEENEEPGSGFDGGQPDPTKGEENIENGTPTDPKAKVSLHEQITDTVLEVVVTVGAVTEVVEEGETEDIE